MSIITLHVLHRESSDDFGELRIAALPDGDGERVVVFDGLPPNEIGAHPGLPSSSLQGDLDGKRAYTEEVPRGVRLSDHPLPAALGPVVGAKLLAAMRAIHDQGGVHGLICAQRVQLGVEGEVVLFGRGRRGGSPELDREALSTLLDAIQAPGEGLDLEEREGWLQAEPDQTQALAAHVRRVMPGQGTILDQLYLRVGANLDSIDEVIPDLGTDPGANDGLFDPWGTTTGTGDHTAELTSNEARTTGPPLAMHLWTTLAAPPKHPCPPDRFAEVDGEPSRGIRALLADEAPDTLPALIGGDIPPFLLNQTDEDSDPIAPLGLSATYGSSTLLDTEGDTAIYDTRSPAMNRAMREAAVEGQLAALEARLAEAEQRLRARTDPPEKPASASFRVDLVMALVLGLALGVLAMVWFS
ncbi:MAG: hypothetical protein EA397_10320 [Deltaproteobacteria bacterium]|nr:MAG: hypothetical protein EA397_10320 [Deltaproteobacteria bacterium]